MSIRRGTTPTLTLYVEGVDLLNLKDIVVSLRQGDTLISKYREDQGVTVSSDHVNVNLKQTETLKFAPYDIVEVQIKGQDEGGDIFATNILRVSVTDILDESVMA